VRGEELDGERGVACYDRIEHGLVLGAFMALWKDTPHGKLPVAVELVGKLVAEADEPA
jgi:hypothetical protein